MSDMQSDCSEHREEDLLPLVYEELRRLAAHKMASERPDLTLQATALVHEAYLRLIQSAVPLRWEDRGRFMAAFAEAMRRILVDGARRRAAIKRGGRANRLPMAAAEASGQSDEDLLALDDALARLSEIDSLKADVVRLRYFAGLTVDETAEALGVSPRTVDRAWAYARAWLLREIGGDTTAVDSIS